jgi:hypothetical protein
MSYGIGGGLAGYGQDQQRAASGMLGDAAAQEAQRNEANTQQEAQRKQGNQQLGATLGTMGGMALGAQYGSVGGPWGAVIGGLVGAVAGSLF